MQFPFSAVSGLFSGIRFLRHRADLQRHTGTQIQWFEVPSLSPSNGGSSPNHSSTQVEQALRLSPGDLMIIFLLALLPGCQHDTGRTCTSLGEIQLMGQSHLQIIWTHAKDEIDKTRWIFCPSRVFVMLLHIHVQGSCCTDGWHRCASGMDIWCFWDAPDWLSSSKAGEQYAGNSVDSVQNHCDFCVFSTNAQPLKLPQSIRSAVLVHDNSSRRLQQNLSAAAQ